MIKILGKKALEKGTSAKIENEERFEPQIIKR